MGDNIPALTSLRFFAAFYILLLHTYIFLGVDFWVFRSFILSGHLAVDFFFILSGFILAYTYYPSWSQKRFSYKNFIMKRLARIYPVHFVMLACSVALLSYMGSSNTVNMEASAWNIRLIEHIFLVHAWWNGVLSYNVPSWSISAEFFAYLLFPLYLRFLKLETPILNIFLSLYVFLSCYFLSQFIFGKPSIKLMAYGGIVRIIPEFALGVSAFLFFHRYRFQGRIRLCQCLCLLAIAFCLTNPEWGYITVVLFTLFIYLVAERYRQGGRSYLDHAVLQYLGKISYSLYMVHYVVWSVGIYAFLALSDVSYTLPLGDQVHKMFSENVRYVAASLYIVVSLLLSVVLYHFCETPMRRFLTKKYIR